MSKKEVFNPQHPVALAVEPLRAAAMDRAEQFARKMVEEVELRMATEFGDRQKFAPYPSSLHCNRAQYIAGVNYYNFVRKITETTAGGSRSPNSPDFGTMSDQGIAKFIEETRNQASFQYDEFICKMIRKIGDCTSATLSGSHVWGCSFLSVSKPTGGEVWKTQQIINVSKLGLPFNQWPSRKQK